jgi:Arc/MetJ-type ribon-helix-helix transcriptional regulator
MGAVDLPDELIRTIEQQVAAGRAPSADAFLQRAVARYAEELEAEAEEIDQVVAAGLADIEAGRFTSIATPEDSEAFHQHIMARVRERLAANRD